MPAPAPPANASRQQLISYYSSVLGQLKGTYQGNNAAYKGKSWPQIYAVLLAADPSADPKTLADDVVGLAGAQGFGVATAQAAGETGTATGQIAQGVATGLSGWGSFLAPFEDIGKLFHALGEANTWIRLAKIVIGGTLIIVGVSHLMGAENKITSIARKVPIVPV